MTLKLKSSPTRKLGAKIIERTIKKHFGITTKVFLNGLEISNIDGKAYLHLDVDIESDDCLSTIIEKLDC